MNDQRIEYWSNQLEVLSGELRSINDQAKRGVWISVLVALGNLQANLRRLHSNCRTSLEREKVKA